MPNLHRLFRFTFTLLIASALLASVMGFVAADCRPQTDGSTNRTLCTSIIGGAGDSEITIDADTTITGAVFGDGIIGGKAGDDTIINNGITVATGTTTGSNGDIEGDVIALGNGGDDTLVNNGTVGGDMDGDTALNGSGGNDLLINNGTVGDDMDGDNASANGGNDIIVNNGSVGGDIQGDDNNFGADSVGGNDIIVINGVVEGKVEGDAGVQSGGDDVVMLQNGANGGSDNTLYLYGNDGEDTLVFNFVVADQATLDALAKRIAAANPMRGSLDFNGQTFTWEGFEQLENQVMLNGQTNPRIIGSSLHMMGFTNYFDNASVTIYCTSGSVSVLGTDRTGKGEFLFSIGAEMIASALEQAAAGKTEVELAVSDGQSLWALPNGSLDMNDSLARYHFEFSCGG